MSKSYQFFLLFAFIGQLSVMAQKELPLPGTLFEIEGKAAFLILPENCATNEPIPWVWYAPTLEKLPAIEEKWMFERFLENGIAIAGIDVGESYGSPEGRTYYTKFYREMVVNKGLSKKVSLLARSRGGLMHYNWAVEHPKSVACIAGIYPVGNLSSWPGLEHACGAYQMTQEKLTSNLSKHNPIDRLGPLAKAQVPIFHLHGDKDDVVPLDENSAIIKERYDKLGGPMTLDIVEGQGHNMWTGWFHSQRLVDFVIAHAKPLTAGQENQILLLEAESFQNKGGWVIDQQFMGEMGSPFLLAHGLGQPVEDAETNFSIPQTKEYSIWVRTRDWVGSWKKPDIPEAKRAIGFPGKFRVLIDSNPLPTTFGTETAEWNWQFGGTVYLEKGEHRIALSDLTGFEGRCDAICISGEKGFVPPSDIKQIEKLRIQTGALKSVVDQGEFDLVVVGGGIAGICASVSAARLGLKVALIQNRPVLGGNNSSEVRVWLGGQVNFEPYPNIGNIVNELEQKNKGHYGLENKGEYYEDDMKEALVRDEKNISLYLNFHVVESETYGETIEAVFAQNIETGERIKIRGKYFADCTGHGTVGALSGAEFDMTQEGHMGRCNLFNFIETESEQSFPACPWALDLSQKPFPGRGKNQGIYGNTGLKAMGSWFWESGFDRDPILEGEYIRDWNFRAAYGAWDCLKNVDKEYPNHKFNWMAYIAGTRESRRLLGDVLLTFEDIKNDKKFEDGSVPTSWSLDLHLPYEPYYEDFEGDGFISYDLHDSYKVPYWIPYRSLYSRNISNLFMAGRDISVTHEALGVVRVMRTGGMMGEIVGMAAAICTQNKCNPRDVYTQYLDTLKAYLIEGVPSKFKTKDLNTQTIEKWSAAYRNWVYHPDLVIPPNPDIQGFENVKMTDVPTVFQLPSDDKWYMSFIGFDGQGYQSFIAESEDLIHWSNHRLAMGYGPEGAFDYGGVVLGAYLYENYDIKAPRLLKQKNGKYYSLYGAYPRQGGYELRPGYEGVACSDDGLTWERAKGEPILSVYQDDCGDWEQSCIYQPWLIEHEDQYYNIYNAANGSIEQMGLAVSSNLLDWKRHQNNPVIPNGPEGSFNEKFSSDIKVFWDQDHWVGFFFGVGQGGAHIMAAYSDDLYNWTVNTEPLYKAGGNPSGIDERYAHKISLVWNPENETYYMFYCAVDKDGKRGIGLITSQSL